VPKQVRKSLLTLLSPRLSNHRLSRAGGNPC
jgi:hypothetical protein